MQAFLFIAGKRRQAETKEALAIQAFAARGDPKDLRKVLKEDDE